FISYGPSLMISQGIMSKSAHYFPLLQLTCLYGAPSSNLLLSISHPVSQSFPKDQFIDIMECSKVHDFAPHLPIPSNQKTMPSNQRAYYSQREYQDRKSIRLNSSNEIITYAV